MTLPSRRVQAGLLVVAYLVVVVIFLRPVHLRVWNTLGAIDVLIMACLILPFVVVPRFVKPQLRVTRYAWIGSAVMALDLVFFAWGEFGQGGGGHPSLASLGSYFLAVLKPVLVPITLILLGMACVQGERMLVVATGFLCLVGETLYATYPTEWWGTFTR